MTAPNDVCVEHDHQNMRTKILPWRAMAGPPNQAFCPANDVQALAMNGTKRRAAGIRQATAPRPFFATSVRSFREAPRGRFSPRSHWLTRPVVTLR